MALLLPAGVRAQSAAEEQAFRQAAALADPSIVRIETVGGLDVVGELLTGTGPTTGVVVSPDGLIITSSFNFISKPASILVTLGDGRRFPADQVATDSSRMLTLLKIEATGLVPLPPATQSDLRVGQWAIALGRTYDSPFPGISVGIISALDRIFGRAVQTDAKASPVNYGGPLVDLEGRGIGILVPLSPQGQEVTAGVEWYDSGIGFAVPLADVYAVLDRMKSGENLKPGLAGITFQSAGVLAGEPVITRVRPGSPADDAQLAAGDVITAINGTTVDRVAALQHLLGPRYAGESVTLTVRRGDQSLDVPVELVDKLVPYSASYLGILPARPARDSADAGVTVRAVLPESPAAKGELQSGDVITAIGDEPVTDAAMLRDRISRVEAGAVARLRVSRGDDERDVEITLTSIPDQLPETVPPISIRAGSEPAEGAVQTGRFTAKLPGGEQEFWAYVPENYNMEHTYGLMVWLHPAGDTQEAAMLRAWQSFCVLRGIILVAPKAADISAWTPGESEFVRGVVEQIRSQYTIDPARIAVHGAGGGGAFAWHVAFKHRDLFRGIAVAGAPLVQPPPDNEPDFPQQILVLAAQDDPRFPRLEASAQLLQEMKFPAVLLTLPGEELAPEFTAIRIAHFIDALDRI
ncbi:MAG: PDZ domain-containing protein [Planctomycetaceae bacterium]|nr:PDZ domain-containing protein [Planctomycetaceae bacterium]